MKRLFAMLVLAVFAVGFGVGGMLGLYMPGSDAMTVETYSTSSRALTFNPVQVADSAGEPLEPVQRSTQDGPVERSSPGDWIKESEIEMRPDGVFIRLSNPQWAVLANTNSMDPVFDGPDSQGGGAHLIQKIPTHPSEIQVGDIVSYNSPLGFTIVHRAIEIGEDEDGWYVITKGDNNPEADPWKIRWEMVKRVTVMVVY